MPGNIFSKEKILKSKWLLGASLAIIIFFTYNLTKEIVNRRQLLNEVNNLKSEISSLESGNVELAGLINKLQSLEFVENEARAKLNLKKPGEKVIIVPESLSGTTTQNFYTELSNNVATAKNNPKNWWDYFFKNYY